MTQNDFSQSLQMGIHYFRNGDFKLADYFLKKALQVKPYDAKANKIFADLLIHNGQFHEAIHYLKIVTNQIDATAENLYRLGALQLSCQKFHDAIVSLQQSLFKNATSFEASHDLATAYANIGSFDQALLYYQKCLSLNPNSPELRFNLGRIYDLLNQRQEALCEYQIAIELKRDFSEAWSSRGCALHDCNLFDDAINHFDEALKINPADSISWFNKGITLCALENYDDALLHFINALSFNPQSPEILINKGLALIELKRYEEALESIEKAIELNATDANAWSNKAFALYHLKRYQEALFAIDQGLLLNPDLTTAWSNKGLILHDLKQLHAAITAYLKALVLDRNHAKTWMNYGLALNDLHEHEQAINCFDTAISLKPNFAEAWSNKGVALYELGQYEAAISHLQNALELKNDIPWLFGDLIHIHLKCAMWQNFESHKFILSKGILDSKKIAQPFTILSIVDQPDLQHQCAEIYTRERYLPAQQIGVIPKRAQSSKIRVGYFSPNFNGHAVGVLCAELFKIHNRKQFDIIGFSLRDLSNSDDFATQIATSFDEFITVETLSDLEIANLSREMNIDIAIDLAGHTQYARTGIFSHRAAPIQVNWLGYPGTIGADFMDYLIGDSVVIPVSNQSNFSEKIVYLPNSYLVDDSSRIPSTRTFSRSEFGLPSAAFVFCCLNNDYKFNPKVITVWSEILSKSPNSILWLSANNTVFQKNMVEEFIKRGIDKIRIIFAPRIDSMGDHLARYQLADLFLDTFPYNAHSTALDALKSGTPVLTLLGHSFPSRVAASLLHAIDLPELITKTEEEYIQLAIELAINPQRMDDLKKKLINNRHSSALFNTALFVQNLEKGFCQMMERHHANLAPDHFTV
jgi:protein O-GlcNAc transferase